ncbi:cation diffusion facilitator family transporter [Mucilaginibacter defluvii]|uniref:Cation diffusion facilitator family transporter n=1 Tax=Mucilaginibacter defluvii TaxID=1196019 RepID=A0ABP9GFW6_9SPHI
MAKSYKSIYSALAANLLIAVTKFIAGGFSGSPSMISEGVHSLVDTINQVLILYGIRQSHKPADALHPFGYGKEIYFWSFIVSILIFSLGGGISVYQGIIHIIHADPPGDPTWNYVVLVLSMIFEGSSLWIAIKEFNKVRGNDTWWNAIIKSKDPSSFLVLFEDSAAVIGLTIVLIFMLIGHATGLEYMDGVASVLVGLLLIGVSAILARESRSLLMGEGIAPETKDKLKGLVEADPAVTKVCNIVSTYQSPEEVVLMLMVVFEPDLDTEGITGAIVRLRNRIKEKYKLVRFVIIQPNTID